MSEQPVSVEVTGEQDDCDKNLTITMSVHWNTDLDRLIPYITDELQTLSHDTFKYHWDKPEA
jgi:hypothetical protein